ncbi:aminotransferase class V-fold PLP-dependent enzyme [Anaerotruncus rubiinfantis]|uniref:aminotransferase class V-fold PLP-dependent enzyme n=3 Tax=Anaerotruncus rubiinfantis TaxID=1720200 RepID=UPI0034A4FA7A
MDVNAVRNDFPILANPVGGKPLVYLDNAATTQLPVPVIQEWTYHYTYDNANVHRGAHTLSERSSDAYEGARKIAAAFIGSPSPENIVFTSGTTESINIVANGLHLCPGDEILTTALEHNSNFVPWQRLCEKTGAVLRILPCPDGEIDQNRFERALSARTVLAAVAHVSNVTGAVARVKELSALCRARGILLLVDGAQAIRSVPVDVLDIGCDYYCFSGHKALAPSGTGVLYGRMEALERLNPSKTGGGMVRSVHKEKTTFLELPYRLEAGTPNIAGAICFGSALAYIESLGRADITLREKMLTSYMESKLRQIDGLRIMGNPRERTGVVSFAVDSLHPYDIACILNEKGVAVRTGSHCAHLIHREMGLESTIRASVAFYNTVEEIDCLCDGLLFAIALLKKWRTS